ncbi:MAG: helix-turn-helix domain-containing protein [Micromonosporaceae bacterium]
MPGEERSDPGRPELRELLRTGPFHTALRLTIHARGLSLERLQDRLARCGHRISVSTLSNWQRGTSRPEHARSRDALRALERLLDVPENALLDLLGPRRPRLARDDADQGMTRGDSQRLRQQLGAPPLGAAAPLSVRGVQERYVAGPTRNRWTAHVRIIVEANQSGVDRHIVLFHGHFGVFPEVAAGPTCQLGRVREEARTGMLAVELLFDRPLSRGETYPLEYRLTCADGGDTGYTGRWFRTQPISYDLQVEFGGEVPVGCHRIWRVEPSSPHKDLTELPLIHGRYAHFFDPELEPGFHGIRWEWPKEDHEGSGVH